MKSARLDVGMTQAEAAAQINRSLASVSSYENGTREASYETLVKMAETYETTVGEFFAGTAATPVAYRSSSNTTPEVRRLERRISQLEDPETMRKVAIDVARDFLAGGMGADPGMEIGATTHKRPKRKTKG